MVGRSIVTSVQSCLCSHRSVVGGYVPGIISSLPLPAHLDVVGIGLQLLPTSLLLLAYQTSIEALTDMQAFT